MVNSEDYDNQFEQHEANLKAKEQELRLRELELEIHRDRKPKVEVYSAEPPLSATRKHQPGKNPIQRLGNKLVKFAKFGGFMIIGIALIKAGIFIGMWLTYSVIALVMAGIGYQIFLKDEE